MSDRHVSFDGGLRTLVWVLVGLAAVLALSRVEWGIVLPGLRVDAVALLFNCSLLGLVWWALRREGVAPQALGMSAGLVLPGVLAVAGFYLVLNLVGGGLALATVGPEALGYQWTVPPLAAAVKFAYLLVVAGIVEEVVFRGYLQSKLVALAGDSSLVRVGLAVLVASCLFVASHALRVLVSGVPGRRARPSTPGHSWSPGSPLGRCTRSPRT